MQFMIFISLTWLLLLSAFQSISGTTYPQCENLEQGGFIGGTSGCQSYIYCDGEDSYEGMCPSQLLFNTKDGSCAPADDVDCSDEDLPAMTTAPPTTTNIITTIPTTITTITTINTQATKAEAVPEENADEPTEELPTIATDVEDFLDIQTTTNMAVTTIFVTIDGSTSSPLQACPATDKLDEVIFLPSDVSCSEYFVCYHGTPVAMYCSGQLYFDYLTSKCELPERVNCKIGSVTTPNPKKECTANTFDYFPYPKNCNYFYKCINGFLSLQQCPIGFGWSEEKKLCLKLSQGRCPIRPMEQDQSQAWLNNVFSK